MTTHAIDIQDYVEGEEPILQDPTVTTETVDRAFMDKLAQMMTKIEAALDIGNGDMRLMDIAKFIVARGDAIDAMEDIEVQTWLKWMRELNRSPFRTYPVDG